MKRLYEGSEQAHEPIPDIFRRGNLPDDDREVPNWLKIKNEQFDDVDISHNTVARLIELTSPEFNEFVSSANTDMLLVYLGTMNEHEMVRFYNYLDEVVKLKEGVDAPCAREQFQRSMEGINQLDISGKLRVRAMLEVPLMITSAKNIYHKTLEFQAYIAQDYFDYDADDAFKEYEGHLVKIIWGEMKYVPDHFEQVLDQFKAFYDENNETHQKFFQHLAGRFGRLIYILYRLIHQTEGRETSLDWFTGKMVEQELIGDFQISISQSRAMTTDQKLINFLTTTFMGICDEHDDNYLSSLICVVETLFEWYPVNREACEYAMVEMMKSVALKEVNVENANNFLAFFEELPGFYEVLSYEKIIELKELISQTIGRYRPQGNKVFEQDGVKNKLILLNYLVDMEDLYYESGKAARSGDE